MLKPITLSAFLFFTSGCFAGAEVITVTFSAQNSGGGLGSFSGAELPSGSLVRFGYFDIDDDSIIDMQGDISLLDEFFTVVAEAMVGFFGGETLLDEEGNISDFNSGDNFSIDGGFAHQVTFDPVPLEREGERLVLWAFNSDTIATATEFGIFADSDWETPSSLTLTADLSTVDPFEDLYVGDKGPEQSSALGGDLNKLVPIGVAIPEPSAVVLMLLGLAALSFRRRC